MKSKIWKVIAVAMAAAMIACVGAGCAKNDSKSNEGSKTSVASTTDTSKTESKTESAEGSKTESKEESKTESAEESKTESKEESKTESAEESQTESKDESTTESTEESNTESTESSVEESGETSEEGSTDYEAYANYFGAWEFNAGSAYVGLILNSDGSAVYKDASGNSVPARWTVEDGKLCVRAAGGLEKFDYADDKLVDTDNGQPYLHVETLGVDVQTGESSSEDTEAYAAFFGSWEYDVGGKYVGIIINSDGTAEYKDGSGNSVSGRWTVEEGKLCVRAAGGLEKFDYADDKLVDADNGLTYLHVDTLYVDR